MKIKPSASTAEIKDAYIRGCKEFHPDISKSPESSEQFRQIQEAYKILSNPDTKIVYDYQVGNVDYQTPPMDYDGIPIRSAKKDRTPKQSPAEQIVMQRYVRKLFIY